MVSSSSLLATLLAVAVLASSAYGHGLLKTPVPRSGNDDNYRDDCTTVAAGTPSATYFAGQPFSVTYKINANHGGTYQIKLRKDGGAFTTIQPSGAIVSGNNPETKTFAALEPGTYTVAWIWKSNEAKPYFGCSDIKVVVSPQGITATFYSASGNAPSTTDFFNAVASFLDIPTTQITTVTALTAVDKNHFKLVFTINYDSAGTDPAPLINQLLTASSSELAAAGIASTTTLAANQPSSDSSSSGSNGAAVAVPIVLILVLLVVLFVYDRKSGGKVRQFGSSIKDRFTTGSNHSTRHSDAEKGRSTPAPRAATPAPRPATPTARPATPTARATTPAPRASAPSRGPSVRPPSPGASLQRPASPGAGLQRPVAVRP
ncbi:hypothetical protein CAOG_03886 [Capsaspora owczarzaki ATCC 30864]|uniref:Uncharacterized protein n=1 Tax=Capsaspora owczarzaki (strain ATCC 30864) TaxID=595528 RepID=A0A0D2X2R6_CAPO3|nr:hypothetical protein CAOG_03886 [Capsaspora owczarzaki ATCC 30864]KJE93024.1 hypothetical protein CAOG_003886 [Capsaspora owczarzaki ATCC 30864]|eukprot:XP_004363614.1 hypothetical protein CAOG_03886 [Capsaspora owczarzaki ATCC 30864]